MRQDTARKIVELFEQGVPIKEIAAQFDMRKGSVSRIARKHGATPRHVHGPRLLTVRLLPSVYDELADTANRQHTSPEILAREAIAAWLGAEI